MVQWHSDLHKRKKTGGRKRPWRKKRRYERGGVPIETLPSETVKRRVDKVKGGIIKVRLLRGNDVNLYVPKENVVIKSKITRVLENPSNRDYSRRGVITKGAIIMTEHGKAVVSSRPGQNGVINARLLQD
jgi:small subunit ribosomal protein S8e